MDVLQELLVPEVFLWIPGKTLKRRIHELETAIHVIGDHPLPHGSRDRLELAAKLRSQPLGLAAPAALAPEQACEQQSEHPGQGADQDGAVSEGNQWAHEACAGLKRKSSDSRRYISKGGLVEDRSAYGDRYPASLLLGRWRTSTARKIAPLS